MPDGEAIEAGIVTRSIESAQRKVEARNFDMRKQLLEYDDVSNDQRKVIYQQRNAILDAQTLSAQIASLRRGCFTDLVRQYMPGRVGRGAVGCEGLAKSLGRRLADLAESGTAGRRGQRHYRRGLAGGHHRRQPTRRSRTRLPEIGEANFTKFERMVLLQSLTPIGATTSVPWITCARVSRLRGCAPKQPEQESKREGF